MLTPRIRISGQEDGAASLHDNFLLHTCRFVAKQESPFTSQRNIKNLAVLVDISLLVTVPANIILSRLVQCPNCLCEYHAELWEFLHQRLEDRDCIVRQIVGHGGILEARV